MSSRSTAPKKPHAYPPPPEPETFMISFEHREGDAVVFAEEHEDPEPWLAIDKQHAVHARDWE